MTSKEAAEQAFETLDKANHMVEQLTAILGLSSLLAAFLIVLIVLNVVLLTWVTFK